jgi:uncharacterized Ntn-hydrolase superfamily protein
MLSTFSIVAWDPAAREWGVAVQSKFLAVGSVVPWAEAEVGAIATQAHANTSYGPRGLELLGSGLSAPEVVERLTTEDKDREHRQLGIVDAHGRAAAFTGRECYDWAGHVVGEGYACQGNILAGEGVVQAMAEAFESTEGPLAERLIAALQAGQRAGGDRRGQQSASLLIVKPEGGYGGFADRLIDLRVDDHPAPIDELARLLKLQQLYFGETRETMELGEPELKTVQTMLKTLGYHRGEVTGRLDEATRKALEDFHNVENLEMRRLEDPGRLDAEVYRFLEEKYRSRPKN